MVGDEVVGCLDRVGSERSGIDGGHHAAGEASIVGGEAGERRSEATEVVEVD